MKRIALGALIVLTTVAAAAEQTQRYVVATRRPVREVAATGLARELRDPAERRVTSFKHVFNGFAADLTAAEVESLRNSPEVRYIEPVVERHLMEETQPGVQLIPAGVLTIQAPQAWAGRRSAAINVAVIDSGVDHRHPEFRGAWAGGHNVLEDTPGIGMDGLGHGTHVAGIVAAAHNEFGMVGVAPNVRLWGVKVVDDSGNGTMDKVIEGLDWVVEQAEKEGGRWVVNFSLGGKEESTSEREAYNRAMDKGLILVAASGNDSYASLPAPVSYPAAYPGVIGVGAIDDRNVHGSFSNSGPEVDFVAPGVKVLSTDITGQSWFSYVVAHDTNVPARPLEGSRLEGVKGDYVYCGMGLEGEFPAGVAGKIALIKRGVDTFATKVRRAKEGGAIGVAMFNSDDSSTRWTLVSDDDPWSKTYNFPVAVALNKADGEALAAKGSGKMTIAYDQNDYSQKTGTSMSTPHVVGAIALLWSLAPNATSAQIYNALMSTAKDLGPAGKDDLYGHGLIDVNAAARLLAPEAFVDDGGNSGRTGRRFLKRTKR